MSLRVSDASKAELLEKSDRGARKVTLVWGQIEPNKEHQVSCALMI